MLIDQLLNSIHRLHFKVTWNLARQTTYGTYTYEAAMVMKIYGAPNSGNCMRAILALFDSEVDVDKEVKLVRMDFDKDDQKKPDYLVKNPLGRLPCLEDGDLIVFESRAIARYLAEKYQQQRHGFPLLGHTLNERATINQWCEVEGQNFVPAAAPIFREVYFATRPAGSKKRALDEELVTSCVRKVAAVLDLYEAQLSKFKYIAGNEYTLADAFHIPYLYKFMNFRREEVFGGRKRVIEWAERLIKRPAFQETLKRDSMWSKE